jgi:hypothetical protein
MSRRKRGVSRDAVWSGHADGGLCECGKISSVLDFAIGATRDHEHDTSNIIFPASYRGVI